MNVSTLVIQFFEMRWLMHFIFILSLPVVAQDFQYPRMVFDNARMEGAYYYSQASYSGDSWIRHSNNHLSTSAERYYTPGNSLVLQYVSTEAGNWKARVRIPELRGRDRFKPASHLVFRMYGAEGVPASELPDISLMQDTQTTRAVRADMYLKAISEGTGWKKIAIPLTEFGLAAGADVSKISAVVFGQSGNTQKERKLFIDQILFESEIIPAQPASSVTPQLISTTGLEQHVDLQWKATPEGVKYVTVYRSADNKNFRPIAIQYPHTNMYTDFVGKSGATYYYKLQYVWEDDNESNFSNALPAKTRKLNNEEFLTMIQRAHFRYYWDGAEKNSGLALENIPGRPEMIATGASGFGLMALVVGAQRNFITRSQFVARVRKVIDFLEKADTFHGAVSHFIDGRNGKVVPFFGPVDNGGDLVETSFLMQGLLALRPYLNNSVEEERKLAARITKIWERVEWSWYRRDSTNQFLYWHWSPQHGWKINHKLIGFNETMITYLLAIASPTFPVSSRSYYEGFASPSQEAQRYRMNWGRTASGSNYFNRDLYHGVRLPVGVSSGGPLFFTHYSYFAMDPRMLTDSFTNYFENNRSIALINQRYCSQNPGRFAGYSDSTWGLTGSDGPEGYAAHEPSLHGDNGTITPTGAVASIVYTPAESLAALRNYYYNYGKFLWGEYGFRDAFNLSENWCAEIYMGLNQAPITIMIENYRTGLIWKLFARNPEIQQMLKNTFMQNK
jgi:exo beta-1,2-glucooligosaccharide sophorohydrolase (non-reducing end)